MARNAALLIEIQSPAGDWIDAGVIQSRDDRNSFEMWSSYWEVPNRPVLGQIFEERGRAWAPSAYTALPKWFSHLLPEGRLRTEVARAASTNAQREFELLERLGFKDLAGAVRAIPVDPGALEHPDIEDEGSADDPESDPILKFSLAGIQLKFSVYGSQRGLTVPAKGVVGNVILKLPDGRDGFGGVPEAELGCLMLATAAGIEAADAWLTDVGAVRGLERWAMHARGQALAVMRFDRKVDGGRVHMEDFAQLMDIPVHGQHAKYRRANFETIAALSGGLCGPEAVLSVIDRIVLNVLLGNGDAHLKNWAITYPDGVNAVLSPAYDVVPTVLYLPDDDLGLKLNGSRIFSSVQLDSFSRLGGRTTIGEDLARKRASVAATSILDNWSVLRGYLTSDAYEKVTSRLSTLGIYRDVRHPS